MIVNAVISIVREFLAARLRRVDLSMLIHVRSRAIRVGVWWRASPLRRALLESVIDYLRRGFIIRSEVLLAMVRDALLDVLTLLSSRRLSFVAYVVGSAIGSRSGVSPVVVGLQWLNRPWCCGWAQQ